MVGGGLTSLRQAAWLALTRLVLIRVAQTESAAENAAPESRELALCLGGQLRGICSPDDFASLFDVFLANFATVDVYLLFPTDNCTADVRLFESAAARRHTDLRFVELCQDERVGVEEEEIVQRWLHETYEGQGLRYFNNSRYVRGMRMTHATTACAQAIQQRENRTSYRFVARARPDVLWQSFVSRAELEAAVPPLILTNFVAMPIQGVVEDTFAIGAWSEMKRYADFRDGFHVHYQRLSQTVLPWCVVHATLRSPEICNLTFMENLLEEYLRRHAELQIQKRRAICFDRVAPCMEARSHYCVESPRHPRGFVNSRSATFDRLDRDFFLTALANYADYDSVLAARLAHFLHAEGLRLGHPPRVLDLGCGRGSYVEALNSWGIPALGVDGDAVLGRSLPRYSLRWDLSEPLELDSLHFPGQDGRCSFTEMPGDRVEQVSRLLSQELGLDQPMHLEIRRGIPGLGSTASLGEHLTIGDLLRFLCCLDARCAGFTLLDDAALVLKWVVGESEDSEKLGFTGDVTFRDNRVWIEYPPEQQSPFTRNDLLGWHGASHVKFSQADWVISLDLGSEVPRWGEAAVIGNIARLAAEGAVVSWGQGSRNPRPAAELLGLLEAEGLSLDLALTRELRLFAGLAHGRARGDLLALRRRGRQAPMLGAVRLVKEIGGDNMCPTGPEALGPGASGFGSLGPGRFWVRGPAQRSARRIARRVVRSIA